jgi:ERCC4-type nuclease
MSDIIAAIKAVEERERKASSLTVVASASEEQQEQEHQQILRAVSDTSWFSSANVIHKLHNGKRRGCIA